MANVISVTVYDFNAVGNKKYGTNLMGLPTQGAFVSPVQANGGSPDPSVYVYSKISYPGLGPATPHANGYYTAETVAQIITKMNA